MTDELSECQGKTKTVSRNVGFAGQEVRQFKWFV